MTEEADRPVGAEVTAFPSPAERPGVVSDRRIMATARRLRGISAVLEWFIFLLIAASVALFGSVHRWAYIPLWYSALALLAIVVARTWLVHRLRQQLGPQRFSFHTSDRWLILDDESPYGIPTWSFDLGRPLLPRAPFLLPAAFLAAWVVLQVVAMPPSIAAALNVTQPLGGVPVGEHWRPLTVSMVDTFRGLAFLLTALVFHVAAAVAFDRRESRAALLRRLRVLGVVLSVEGLAQLASGTRLIYWFHEPHEYNGNILSFGPFSNRNHFAAYMLMLTALAFGWLTSRLKGLSRSVGRSANMRRLTVNVLQRSGPELIYAAVPALTMVGALIATTSRGALIAFAACLILASLRLFRRARTPSWGVTLLFTAVALTWFGMDRLESRFGQLGHQASGRTVVWRDSLQRMEGRWITGFGLDTFGAAISRTTAWTLPVGATPWMDPYETSVSAVARAGFRAITDEPELLYYREAHNDYLQLLTEVGAVGLLLALWGVFRVVRRSWGDPWLLAAVVGPLLHAFVDFGLQIPAVAVLFAVVTGLRPAQD